MTLAGPYLVACFLLVAAGVAKAARPSDTARALHDLVPAVPPAVAPVAVRVLACAEAVLGAAALVAPVRAVAAAVGASYFVFSVVVAYARRRGGPLASCGCFGTPDTPATRLHLVVDLVLAASGAVAAATLRQGAAFAELSGQPLHGVPLVLSAAVGAAVVVVALGPAARLGAVRTPT
jgi:hypothetical protein